MFSFKNAVVSFAFAAAAVSASAQVLPAPVEFSVEGKINAIGADTLTVLGTTFQVPAGLAIDTPTGQISFADLSAADKPSLIGVATIIATGNTGTDGVNIADAVFVEVAENVLGATVESVNGNELTVYGGGKIRINLPGSGVGDPRFEAVTFPNAGFSLISETGYPVSTPGAGTTDCVNNPAILGAVQPLDSTLPCAIAPGELVSAEGDYRTDANGVSYTAAHTIEAGKLVLYNPSNVAGGTDYISTSTAATLENTNRFSLRGFGTFAGGRVFVYRSTAACVAGTQLMANSTTPISATMGAGDGRFRFDKATVSTINGNLAFTHVVIKSSNPGPNAATACVPVSR